MKIRIRAYGKNPKSPIHPKIAQRGKEVKRRNRHRVLLVVLVCTALAGLGYAGKLLFNSSIFAISKVDMFATNNYLKSALLPMVKRQLNGKNYFSISVNKIETKLLNDPLIATASVVLHFPHTADIYLKGASPQMSLILSNAPLVVAYIGGRYQVISNDAKQIQGTSVCLDTHDFTGLSSDFSCAAKAPLSEYFPYLPRISAIKNGLTRLNDPVESVYICNGYGIGIQDARGRFVYFSDQTSLSRQFSDLASVMVQALPTYREVIDLTVNRHPTITPPTG